MCICKQSLTDCQDCQGLLWSVVWAVSCCTDFARPKIVIPCIHMYTQNSLNSPWFWNVRGGTEQWAFLFSTLIQLWPSEVSRLLVGHWHLAGHSLILMSQCPSHQEVQLHCLSTAEISGRDVFGWNKPLQCWWGQGNPWFWHFRHNLSQLVRSRLLHFCTVLLSMMVIPCSCEIQWTSFFPTCQVRVSRFYQSHFSSPLLSSPLSSWAALPDRNRELQISMGIAGRQLRAPELSALAVEVWRCSCQIERQNRC